MNNIATLEVHSLKELLVLRKVIQERMNYLKAIEHELPYRREHTIEYLTLGQILVRLPTPALLTQRTCTQDDIQA